MIRYHIKADGTPGICRASVGNCPLGGSESHFKTREDAQAYADKQNEENYFAINNSHEELYETKLKNNERFSQMEAIERGHWVEEQTAIAIASGHDSFSQYYNKEEGLWSDERQELHAKILSEFESRYADVKTNGEVIISGGLPGAGKTTVLTKAMGIDLSAYATISADDFKEKLAEEGAIPEVQGLTPMEASTLVHEESSYLAEKLMASMSRQNKNIIYDCTCRNQESTKSRIKSLINKGYKSENMQFVFVDIPIDTAHERAKYRYREGLNDFGLGGRYLPGHIIDNCSAKTDSGFASRNAETVVNLFNDDEFDFKTPIVYNNKGDYPVEIDYNEFKGDV